MNKLEARIRLRGGNIFREDDTGVEYPVLMCEVLSQRGSPIRGGAIQIPLNNETKGILAHIQEQGTLSITID